TLDRIWLSDSLAQATPELGLPDDIAGQVPLRTVGVPPATPRAKHRGSVQRVVVEEISQVPHGAKPASAARWIGRFLGVAHVKREAAQPRLAQSRVHDFEQRPDRTHRQPAILLGRNSGRLRHCVVHQGAREWKLDVRAYAVEAPIARPE